MYHHWSRYLTPDPLHLDLGLACLGVGHQEGRLPVVGPRILPHHVAVLVTAGSGWFGQVPVQAPAVLWLTPGVAHHYGPHEEWTEWFVDFAGPAAAAYAELGFIGTGVQPLETADPVAHEIGRVARVCREEGPYAQVEASSLVHGVLMAIRRSRTAEHADPLLQALARDACLPIPVTEHARRLGVPLSELRHIVKRLTGSSPKDYLLAIRLNRAKDLLAASDLPVAAVARRAGYDDPAYFTRIFTRRVGMPPSEFRAQQYRGHTA
ncbi:AraC family transcriptional regulator [Nonomuraea sp. NPDC050663]|uniref:AraC family transcriptional regulator n=1 Tax=Nonomuraea sp. NPDC050663 TaxID=3364370 RepID=UPI00379A27B1